MSYFEIPLEHIEKIIFSFNYGYRFILKDYNNNFDNWYAQKAVNPSDFAEHMALVKSFAEQSNAALELGTRYATSTAAMAYAKELITIDKDDCSEYIPKDIENVCFKHSCTLSFDYDTHYLDKRVDLVLIDTIHTYEQVKAEYNAILSVLANDAIIMFHDYNIPEVKKAVKEIAKEEGVEVQVNGYVFPLAYIKLERE
jgi:predicted O-methyltransferase YrrM